MMSRSRLLRCISAVMSVLMLFAMVPLTASAADADSYTEISGVAEDIAYGGSFRLTDDANFYGEINSATVIDLNGHTLTLGLDGEWDVITVYSSLTLEGTGTLVTRGQSCVVSVAATGTLNIASAGVSFSGGTCDIALSIGGKITCGVELTSVYSVSYSGAAGDTVVECGSIDVAQANQDNFTVNGKELAADGTKLCIESNGITTQYVSLVLDGAIGLKFYFHFPSGSEPTTLYYQIAANAENSAAEVNGTLDVGEYNSFVIDVPATRLSDTVYVWFDADTKPDTVNAQYSVSDYIAKIKSTYSADSKLYKLVNALGVYGEYVTKYSNGTLSGSANPPIFTSEMDDAYEEYQKDNYKPRTYYDTFSGLEFGSMRMVLGSEMVMRFSFKNNKVDTFTWQATEDHRIRVYSSATDADGSVYNVFSEKVLDKNNKLVSFADVFYGECYIDISVPVAGLDDIWRVEIGYYDANGKWQCDAGISVSPMWYIANLIVGAELPSGDPLRALSRVIFAYNYYANEYYGA